MNLIDYIALAWAAFALWGLTTAYPNYRKARDHQRSLKAKGINGFNARIARKERRLHRNITVALCYILVLGVSIALPTIQLGPITLSGALLSAGLLFMSPYLALWSHAERDDGESAHLELLKIATDRLKEMEAHHDNT